MANRFAGIAFVKADGDPLPLRGSFTVSPSKIARAGIAGQDGVHGYSENPRVPYIEGDISDTPEVSVEALQAMKGVTVTAELANGKTWVLRDAWTSAAFEINTHDGQFRVRWEGMSCEEI